MGGATSRAAVEYFQAGAVDVKRVQSPDEMADADGRVQINDGDRTIEIAYRTTPRIRWGTVVLAGAGTILALGFTLGLRRTIKGTESSWQGVVLAARVALTATALVGSVSFASFYAAKRLSGASTLAEFSAKMSEWLPSPRSNESRQLTAAAVVVKAHRSLARNSVSTASSEQEEDASTSTSTSTSTSDDNSSPRS